MGPLAFIRWAVARPWRNAPRMIGLTLEEGKHRLLALLVHLVQAKLPNHDQNITPNQILVGPISIAPHHSIEGESTRYRCGVTCRRTFNQVSEIMRDRCTPEHERTVAKMGSLVPSR